ncbi:MAG: VIT1/CCC1 transporter family protein [Nitrososphaerales archaeon]
MAYEGNKKIDAQNLKVLVSSYDSLEISEIRVKAMPEHDDTTRFTDVSSRDLASTKPERDPTGESRILHPEIHKHIRGRGLISSAALGLSDGLVSNIAFLAGFAGANSPIAEIRLAGVAAMIAGAVSMFFGGILAGRSERDLFAADSKREASEIEYEPEEERQELRGYYLRKGLKKEEADMVIERVTADKQKWLEDILVHELHIHEAVLESPYKMGGVIGFSFLVGAFVPLVPYLILSAIGTAIYASILLSLAFLFVVGIWKGAIVRKNRLRSGLEMLVVGVIASMLLYTLGHLFIFV